VDRGPIEHVVSATGTVNPVTTVQVGTYVSGPIQALDVGFNAPVKKGQRVAKIDPAPFAVKVREAEASLQNAQAKVVGDRADAKLKKLLLERNRVLLARNLIAQNDVDTAETAYELASAQLALDQAAVALAQGSLDEAKVNLRYTDIVSPVDGVVVSVNVAVGQTVAASFQTPTLFLIAGDLTKMQVDTNVSESDVGRVHEGQPTTFAVDAYPGQPFHGKVAQVRNAPITVQNVVTYDVVIAVENPGLELKPGMTANVSVTTAKRDQALRIPVRALRFRPDRIGAGTPDASAKEESAVYVLAPERAVRREDVGGERRLRPRAGRRAPARRGGSRHPRQSARGGAEGGPSRGGPDRRRPAARGHGCCGRRSVAEGVPRAEAPLASSSHGSWHAPAHPAPRRVEGLPPGRCRGAG